MTIFGVNILLARVLFVQLDAQDKRVEAKEYDEGAGQALNDHPTLHAEDLGLDGARVPVLELEGVDDPHGQVAEQQKVADIAPWHPHGPGALGRYVLGGCELNQSVCSSDNF